MSEYPIQELEAQPLNVEALISKSEWKSLCEKYERWCSFETVMNHTYAESENIIKSMPCWIPM